MLRILCAGFKAQGLEEITTDTSINHETTNDGNFATTLKQVRSLIENAIQQFANDTIHLIRNKRNAIGGLVDVLEPWLQKVYNCSELRIELSGSVFVLKKVQDSDWIHRGGFFLLQFFVGTNCSTTGRAEAALTISLQSADSAQWSNTNMGSKHYEKFAIFGNMVEVSGESTLSCEGQATKSTECKCFSPPSRHERYELLASIVDLIRTDGVSKQRVLWRESPLPQCPGDGEVGIAR
mmetsp:Transcript_5396/g.15284  ORF Transcript_5396/g.15284 Transcript_5396/m.15284 type:complete len:237 (-) Transcript_5396:438-1148(-)